MNREMRLDNLLLHEMRENAIAKAARKRPACSLCGEPIFKEYAYQIRAKYYCPACVDDSKVYIEEDEF